jgi:SNF2 family DNA or RNA helicase
LTARPFYVGQPTRPPAVTRVPPGEARVKIDAAYGRLYVTGPSAPLLQRMPGAAWNTKKNSVELSLTLETLRGMRKVLGLESEAMARMCTKPVLSWAKAAGRSEKMVNELHAKLATGWRQELSWVDTRAGTPAPDSAPENAVDLVFVGNGRPPYRNWKYRPPYEHQKLMATAACWLDGVALLGEMGTGKTRSACEAIRHKFDTGEIDLCFVTCPKGALNVWEQQIKWWAPDVQVVRLSGAVKKREAAILNIGLSDIKRVVFLVNYDVVYLMLDTILMVMDQRRAGLVPDEMHKLTNPEALVTKAFMEASRHARWRCAMTGTPISNRVEGVWSEWYIVDLGITFGANSLQFRREFFDENSYSFKWEPKANSLDEIGLRMRRRGVRVLKKDCLDLPEKVYQVETVEMTREQRKAYIEMRDELVTKLESHDDAYATAATQLVAILRLTQITSGFVPDEEGILRRFKPNPKLDALEEFVRDNITDAQIIVWAVYREDVRAIVERLSDLNPAIMQGGQTDRERLAAETDFQEGRKRLLVGNPAAGGVGTNLQAASIACYYSLGYSLIDRMQSEDRCHRSGSEVHNRVLYVDFLCENSVDPVIRDAVADKKEVAEIVVDLKRALGVVV